MFLSSTIEQHLERQKYYNTLARQKLRFLMSVTPNPFSVES